MEIDLDAVGSRYNAFFDQRTDESVDNYRELASPDIHYRDPMVDVKGIDATLACMHKWFEDLDELEFETIGQARSGKLAFAHWRMTFRAKKSPKKLWEQYGVSRVVLDDSGKAVEHEDYWDATPLLQSIPILGRFVSLAKKLVGR